MKTKHLIFALVGFAVALLSAPAFAADSVAMLATAGSFLGDLLTNPHSFATMAGAGIVAKPLSQAIGNELHRKNGGDDESTKRSVEAALKSITDQVNEFCQKNKGAIEDGAKLAKTAKEAVDELLTKQGELRERLQDVEQRLAKAQENGGQDSAAETAGDAFAKFMDENPELAKQIANVKQGQNFNIPMSRKAITNSGTTGLALAYPAQVVAPIQRPLERRLTIRDLLAVGRTDASAIFYPKESGFTNNAAVVSEGSLKPESDLTFTPTTEAVVTIAHWLRISKQMAADVPALVSYINSRLTYGLKLVEENQLLNGSGTGGNLEGIYTAATAYSNTTSLPNETDLDKIRLAILQAELAFAEVNGIVLHPTNWALMELTKDTTGQYVFARPQESATPRLWGRNVVATPAMTQGRFLVGDFAQHAQIFDREDASVSISAEDRDNFVRNMLTILVEERLALAIYRPEAFVKGRLESSTGPGAA
jgi:HK97 family phage major capsid protein